MLYCYVLLQPTLNAFMALGRPAWSETRETLQRILSSDEPVLRDNADLRARYKNALPTRRVS